ncbi:hypothetical protein [Robinsoniella peoriensis]|uniref:hypothetical protein n=1 Tax=Robinsoniella peoriensis TaxID=180332 RepID=UPI0037536EBE
MGYRRTTISLKNKKVYSMPQEDWVIVKNMHEPIVSENASSSSTIRQSYFILILTQCCRIHPAILPFYFPVFYLKVKKCPKRTLFYSFSAIILPQNRNFFKSCSYNSKGVYIIYLSISEGILSLRTL